MKRYNGLHDKLCTIENIEYDWRIYTKSLLC